MEKEDNDPSSVDEGPTQVCSQNVDQSPNICACFAFAPIFAIDVMWEQEDTHPNDEFQEL